MKGSRLTRRLSLWTIGSIMLLYVVAILLGHYSLFGEDRSLPITIVLRFDDYSSISDSIVEDRLISVLRKHGTPCTFAVIPAVTTGGFHSGSPADSIPLTEPRAAVLRSLVADGLIEVAQHGLTHQTAEGRNQKTISEFTAVPLDIQRRKIAEGKRILEQTLGVKIQTFVPPWERYDENTLVAADEAGITIFSAAKKGVNRPADSLVYIPSSFALPGLQKAVDEATRIPDTTATIIAVAHEYDFVDSLPQYNQLTVGRLDSTLTTLSRRSEIRFLTMSEAADVIPDLNDARQSAYARYMKSPIHNLLPSFLEDMLPRRVYVSADYSRKLLAWGWIWLIATGVTILVVTTLAIALVASFLPRISRAVHVILLVAIAILIGVGAYMILADGEMYFDGLSLILLGTGALAGGLLGLRVIRRDDSARPLASVG